MTSKPDKYTVRFYGIVDVSTLQFHTVYDNSSGSKMPKTAAERYVDVFPDMWTPLQQVGGNNLEQTTTVWAAMIIQQCDKGFHIIYLLLFNTKANCKIDRKYYVLYKPVSARTRIHCKRNFPRNLVLLEIFACTSKLSSILSCAILVWRKYTIRKYCQK